MEVQVPAKEPTQRKQPSTGNHAGGVWEAASGSDSWKGTPPSDADQEDDAPSMTRLGNLFFCPPAKETSVVLADLVPSAPPVYVDFAMRVRKATYEIKAMNCRVVGIDKLVHARQNNLWIKCTFGG